MAIMLDNLKSSQTIKSSPWKLLTGVVRHIWKSGYQQLLIPVTIYRGLSPTFLMGDFNAVRIVQKVLLLNLMINWGGAWGGLWHFRQSFGLQKSLLIDKLVVSFNVLYIMWFSQIYISHCHYMYIYVIEY